MTVICIMKETEEEVMITTKDFHLSSLGKGMHLVYHDDNGDIKMCGPLKMALHSKVIVKNTAIFPGQTHEDFQ